MNWSFWEDEVWLKQIDLCVIGAGIVGLNTAITGGVGGNLVVDVGFGATTPRSSITLSDKNVDLGQSFVKGKANPDVKKYSGDIIYIDNRAPITRSTSQKEEVKIVIEF